AGRATTESPASALTGMIDFSGLFGPFGFPFLPPTLSMLLRSPAPLRSPAAGTRGPSPSRSRYFPSAEAKTPKGRGTEIARYGLKLGNYSLLICAVTIVRHPGL